MTVVIAAVPCLACCKRMLMHAKYVHENENNNIYYDLIAAGAHTALCCLLYACHALVGEC